MEGAGHDAIVPGVQWLEPCPSSLGTFFINKVGLNSEPHTESLYWAPSHLQNTSTKILSFEELVSKDGLEKALVMNSCKLSEILDDCFYFLPQTKLTVVCFPESAECPSTLERTIKVCPHHKTSQFTILEGAVSGTVCGCHDCSRLTIIHSPHSRKMRTKLFLLRYKDFLRIVIPSGNLGPIFWEKLGLFGWFIDVPYKQGEAEAGDSEPGPTPDFELELKEVLRWLKVENADKWLENADFRNISPAVHLVGGLPQWRKSKVLGANLLLQLVNPVRRFCRGWQQMRYIQSHAVNSHFDEVKKLFNLDLTAKGSFKIIFPSSKCIEHAVQSTPNLTMKDVDVNANLKYLEAGLLLKHFLHKADDSRVLPYANVYMETFTKPDVSQQQLLGWFLFGSQTFGNVSWGLKEKMDRHELGVAIVPYMKDDVLHAIDLSRIGFHFSLNPPAYDSVDFPIISGKLIYRCQGQVVPYPGRVAYRTLTVSDIPEAEKYQLNCLPCIDENHPITQASVFKEVWEASLDDFTLAHPGVYLDFVCQRIFRSKQKQGHIRISHIVSAHKKLSGLLRSLGKEAEANEVEKQELTQPTEVSTDDNFMWGEQCQTERPKSSSPKLSYHQQKFKELYGEGTEEDFEKYWTEQFEQTYAFPTIIPSNDYKNYKPEEEFDVTPWTSKMDDTVWLERQVRKMCNPLPKLVGQFSVPYLKCNFSMLGHKMFPGLDNIEKAASKEVK